jgi:hypothetical protein
MLVIGATLISSCGASKTTVHDAVDVLQRINATFRSTPDLTIDGSMQVSKLGITIWFDTYVRGHDSIQMILNGPFGIAVGSLYAKPDELLFLNFQEGIAYEGTPNRETMRKATRLGLSYDEIVALMRCEVPHIPDRAMLDSTRFASEQNDGTITYTFERSGVTEVFVVDPERLVLTDYKRIVIRAGKEYEEMSVRYADFYNSAGGRKFPETADLSVDGGALKLSVTIESVKDEVPASRTFALTVPGSMSRQRL